ncbi:g7086 [Coccomyxa viridis]|uniref:G7086 protein n=1 Tax=Coccomyxa viridis TaxID=1274662 RepID=A0ABP1FZI5_9CHLO
MAAESGPQYAMHGQSLRHALKGGQQGGRAAALGDSSGREEQSVGGRDVQSDLASAVPAGAFQIGPEPEPSTSKVSGSSQQGLRASQKMDAESRGVGLLVLWFRELGKSIREPFAVLEELTYPDPRGILRLTFIVLAATAVLTALVWSIDRTFAALLFPPVARRLCQGASLRGL